MKTNNHRDQGTLVSVLQNHQTWSQLSMNRSEKLGQRSSDEGAQPCVQMQLTGQTSAEHGSCSAFVAITR